MKIVWEMDINHANQVLKILGDVTGMSWSQINPIISPLVKQTDDQVKAANSKPPDGEKKVMMLHGADPPLRGPDTPK